MGRGGGGVEFPTQPKICDIIIYETVKTSVKCLISTPLTMDRTVKTRHLDHDVQDQVDQKLLRSICL